MKESQFLATILIESPLRFEILERIRDKYSIDNLDPTKDPYKQRVRQDMKQDPPIDWQAVRQALRRVWRHYYGAEDETFDFVAVPASATAVPPVPCS